MSDIKLPISRLAIAIVTQTALARSSHRCVNGRLNRVSFVELLFRRWAIAVAALASALAGARDHFVDGRLERIA